MTSTLPRAITTMLMSLQDVIADKDCFNDIKTDVECGVQGTIVSPLIMPPQPLHHVSTCRQASGMRTLLRGQRAYSISQRHWSVQRRR